MKPLKTLKTRRQRWYALLFNHECLITHLAGHNRRQILKETLLTMLVIVTFAGLTFIIYLFQLVQSGVRSRYRLLFLRLPASSQF